MRFNSILVANRGEIACRIMQTAQFMGIKCVAVFVDADKDAPFVKMVEQMSDQMSEGLVASSMVTDDGIIDPRDTRSVIGFCLSIVSNSSIDGAKEYGVFRL